MTRGLIVNADDFGLCREISTGILRAYSDGIVTAASVVVNGRYFRESVHLLKDSGIDTGIHLTLTGGEKPVSGNVPGLVDNAGRFLRSYREVIPRILLGRFDRGALERELSAQIVLLRDSGSTISHIDSHQHLHLLPGIRGMVMRLAQKFGIPWIRVPQSHRAGVRSLAVNLLARGLKQGLQRYSLSSTDAFIGFDQGGHMGEAGLSDVLGHLADGVTELMVHPGYDASAIYDWGYAWEDELRVLTSGAVRRLIEDRGITLKTFREIA